MKKSFLVFVFVGLGCSALRAQTGPVSITSTQCATLTLSNHYASAAIDVSGTWSGTLQPTGIIQGQSAKNIQVTAESSGSAQSTITGNGLFKADVSGYDSVQLCGASISSGTATIYINPSSSPMAKNNSGGGASSCAGLSDAAASCSTDTTLVANVVGAAPLTSPALTGTPTAPTPGASDNSTKIATTAYVKNQGYATTSSLAAVATSGSAADLGSGTLPAARLPNPSSSTLGGIESFAVQSHKFVSSISTLGVPNATQPACGDLSDSGTGCGATLAIVATSGSASDLGSGTLGAARFPSFTNHALLFGNGSAGSPSLLSSPLTNGNCIVRFNVIASAAVDPTCALSGILVNAQSGSYSLLYSDRASYLDFNGGTTATATLPQVTATTANNFPFVTQNRNSGNLTLTANAADKIDNSATGGSATVLPSWGAFVYQDSSSAPGNWWTFRLPTFAAFGSTCSNGMTWSTTTGFSCLSAAPVTSGASAGGALGGTYPNPTIGTITNGATATTQAANSNDTKVSTNAYADRVIAAPLLTGNAVSNTVRVSGSDFTTTSASLVAITGLSWTLPANTAANYGYTCNLLYSEGTSATAIGFGVQDVTTAPTQANSNIFQQTSATTAFQGGNMLALASTTATSFSTASPTTTNVISTQINGLIEQPSGSASVWQIMVKIASGVTATVKRGSYCTITQSAS